MVWFADFQHHRIHLNQLYLYLSVSWTWSLSFSILFVSFTSVSPFLFSSYIPTVFIRPTILFFGLPISFNTLLTFTIAYHSLVQFQVLSLVSALVAYRIHKLTVVSWEKDEIERSEQILLNNWNQETCRFCETFINQSVSADGSNLTHKQFTLSAYNI